MKPRIICALIFILLTPDFINPQTSTYFEIFGFGRTTDISSLCKRFPSSNQGATDPSGKYIYHKSPAFIGADGRQYPGSESGTYLQEKAKSYQIWFSRTDIRNSIGYAEFGIENGGVKRLRLSFEMPENQLKKKPTTWAEGHYASHPVCTEILTPFVKKYGEPNRKSEGHEERLSFHKRHWLSSDEELILTCYQLDGKGKELALDAVITAKE